MDFARDAVAPFGRAAAGLLTSPVVTEQARRLVEARERLVGAQEFALAQLSLPSGADIERLTRRVRSVAQRLEGVEDGVDRNDERLAVIERHLAEIAASLSAPPSSST